MNKCSGCGSLLQNVDKLKEGYVSNLENKLCERCFRIKNYNEYKILDKTNEEYINIFKNISNTDDLVVLVIDIFNINKNLLDLEKYIKNKILLVLTKRDLLPKSCNDNKLKDYFNKYNLNIVDKVIISSFKNYNFDELFNKINIYKNSNKVYVVGYTNAGKSTMINKIIKNYSLNDLEITTSNLPSTTIDCIDININDDLVLIDTPGLLDDKDIINYLNIDEIKKIIPKKEIKPRTYQIKEKQTICIEDIVSIFIKDNTNITLYISNDLKIDRKYKDLENIKKHDIVVKENNDLVIQGLGFIKFTKESRVSIYINQDINIFTRESLI